MKGMHTCGKKSLFYSNFFFISRSIASSFLRFEFLQNIFTALCLQLLFTIFFPSFLLSRVYNFQLSLPIPPIFIIILLLLLLLFFSFFYPTFSGMVWQQSILTWSHIHKTSSCVFLLLPATLISHYDFGDGSDLGVSVCLDFGWGWGDVW